MALADSHFDSQVSSGDMAGGDPLTSLALHSDSATSLGVVIGDTVEATFPDNQSETLTLVAVYEDAAIYGNWLIDGALWDRHFNRNDLAFASARIAGLSDAADEARQAALLASSRAAIDDVIDRYPTVKVENQAEFRQTQESQITSFIRVIQVLIGLSFFIALIGIINTLSLSVFERTREIGLLRSVGMTRRQLRRSIYWEALIVAVFGGPARGDGRHGVRGGDHAGSARVVRAGGGRAVARPRGVRGDLGRRGPAGCHPARPCAPAA